MKRARFLPVAAWLLPVALALLAAVLSAADPVPLQQLRHAVFDQFQRWHPRVPLAAAESPVLVVDIDDESLRRLGQWPWPRSQVAAMVSRLQQADAAAIAFDVVFAEPDRTAPRAAAAHWPLDDGLRRRLAALPDPDDALAAALRRGRVVLGMAVQRAPLPQARPLPPTQARFVIAGEQPERVAAVVHGFAGAVAPLPALAAAADGYGALSFVPDDDGVVRRVPLLVRQQQALLPSLDTEALRVAQGVRNVFVQGRDSGAGEAVERVRIGQVEASTTPQAELWVHYAPQGTQAVVPAWQVLAGALPPAMVAGRIVLVGTSAQGLLDLRFSPLGGVVPGVAIHAQALEQLLAGEPLQRPAWAGGAETAAAAVLACGAGVLGLASGALVALAGGAVLAVLPAVGAYAAFTGRGLLLDPSLACAGVLLALGLCGTLRHRQAERRQRWIRDAFSRYVSPNLVRHLVERPEALVLGGRRQHCSFVFTDLAGYTAQIERMDPADAVALLNAYLDRMVRIAFEHEGTLDRIVGDAVVIMFSAPVEQADHRARALACARAMRRYADGHAEELAARGIAFGRTRIGVHSGEVIVGNLGGATMFDYRALGDPVNTTARLEGANKYLGTWSCVSEATLAGCEGTAARPIGPLLLQGKRQPLMVYEPAPEPTQHDLAYLEAWQRMQQGPRHEALRAFEALAAERPSDALVALQLQRLRAGREHEPIVVEGK